jgi:hypothetical protein
MSKARQNKEKEKTEKEKENETTPKPKQNSISNYFLPKASSKSVGENPPKELISSPKKKKPSEKTVQILASFSAKQNVNDDLEQTSENTSGPENQVQLQNILTISLMDEKLKT